MRKLGVFVDIKNLFQCIDKRYKSHLDYAKYLNFLSDLGTVEISHAFGTFTKPSATNFVYCLKKIGFTPHVSIVRPNPKSKHEVTWDVPLVLEVIKNLEAGIIDSVVLGSSSMKLLPLIDYLIAKKIETFVFACGIPQLFKMTTATCFEITESHLVEPKTIES